MESSHDGGVPPLSDVDVIEAVVSYTVFSVHNLRRNRSLSPGPAFRAALAALEKNPIVERFGPAWPSHAGRDREDILLLLDVNRVFESWDAERRAWLRGYLRAEMGATAEEIETVRALLDNTRQGLLRLVTLCRDAYLLRLERDHLPNPPTAAHARTIASVAWSLGRGEPTAARAMALEQSGLTRREARDAFPFLVKVANWVEAWQQDADDAILAADLPRRWEKLWDDPGESTLGIFNDIGRDLFLVLAPRVVTREDFRGSEQLQERWLDAIDELHVEGIREERARDEEALSRLRSRPDELPVVSRITRPICKILNSYFANWRLRITPESLAKNIKVRFKQA